MTSSLISEPLPRAKPDLPVPIRDRRVELSDELSRSVSESRGETGNAIDGDMSTGSTLGRARELIRTTSLLS